MFTDLRICVVQGGKILNEFLFNQGTNVNIGSSLSNEIVLSGDFIDKKIDLLIYKNGIFYLKLFEGISGKVIENNKILAFDELVSKPGVIRDGVSVYVPLSQSSKGSVLIGDYTLLFRMNASVAVPKEVPKELKVNIFSDFDFSFLLISFFLFLSYIIIVSSFAKFKPKETVKFENVPERFARLIINKPVVIEQKKEPEPIFNKEVNKPEKKEKKEIKNKVSKKVEKKTNDKVKRNVSGTKRRGGGEKPTRKEVAEMVRTSGIIGIIGSKSKSGEGSVVNLFSEQGFGKKLDKALKGVAGLNTGRSLKEVRMKRGGGSAKSISIGNLKTSTGSGAIAFGKTNVSAVNVLGDGSDSEQSGQGSINPGIIAKTLARHIGAFQYCYNKSLRSNAKLSGELKIIFEILDSGKVSRTNIDFKGEASKDKTLTSCITRVFTRIIFPKPKGGAVTVGYPLNFTAQN